MATDEICTSHLTCESNICPLDPDIKLRSYIPNERVCHFIVDYLEGRETPHDDQIKVTEKVWRAKFGEKNLENRVAGRIKLRNVVWNRTKPPIEGE